MLSTRRVIATSVLCLTSIAVLATGTLLVNRPPAPADRAPVSTAGLTAPLSSAARDASFATARQRLASAAGPGASRTVSVQLASGASRTATPSSLALKPLFTLSKAERASLVKDMSADRAASTLRSLDTWFTVSVPDGPAGDRVLDLLNDSAAVARVYVNLEVSLPVAGDFTARQGYQAAAPEGIGVAYAAKVAGGQGDRVKIFDVEFDWNTSHEDLGRAASARISVGSPTAPHGKSDIDHGTAVLGELIGTPNSFGVTGIAPRSAIGLVNTFDAAAGYQLARAISTAAANASRGDVILIEQQLALTSGGGDYVPVEFDPTVFAAIRAAVDAGMIVIEPAANGSQNLDALGIGRSDSGAIMVGAGQVEGCAGFGSATHPRSRASFSDYGSRVDVQGWGECVTTTGYGDLYNGGSNATYTQQFSGTSSASPVVAGAAAVLSSIIETRTGTPATPGQIRSLLKSTGTPQDTSVAGQIGPLPNLERAIQALGGTGGSGGGTGGSDQTAPSIAAPQAVTAVGYQVTRGDGVPTTISWKASDASGIARYAVKVSTDGRAWTDVTLASATTRSVTLNLISGHTYRFTVNARDGAGNWGAWASGPTIKPIDYSDSSKYIGYAGTWYRAAWKPAEAGSVTVASKRGATASFTFTGRGIAWIASQGTTRGQADVWLDGSYVGRVNLYRKASAGRMVAFSTLVSTGTRHTLQVVAVGTAGHPKIDVDGFVLMK
jgi:serine protease